MRGYFRARACFVRNDYGYSVFLRSLSCPTADFIAFSSSFAFRRQCKDQRRSRIALYASLISRESLFLSVSSSASRQSSAHRSICQEYTITPFRSQASQSEMAQHRRRWTGRMRTDNACTSPVRLPLQPSYDAQKARMTRGSRPARLLFMQCPRTAGMIVQRQPAPVSLRYEVRNPTRGTRAFTGL